MRIAIVNHSEVLDEVVQHAVRAINIQLLHDFFPLWDVEAKCVLLPAATPIEQGHPYTHAQGVIHLRDDTDVSGALGYHHATNRGLPAGFVFRRFSEDLGEDWRTTLSHEVLEMVLDPHVNRLAHGPHPDPAQDRGVFHWYESCDAVQARTYEIDRVPLSDFVAPLYFTPQEEQGGRTTFLGGNVPSFGVAPGGYVGFFDPLEQKHSTFAMDAAGEETREAKGALGASRRSFRR